MCLLILIRGADPDYPLIVANNRDEDRGRRAVPPGLYVGANRRMISPRDRHAGGTWLAINDLGMFAGLTNVTGTDQRPDVTTTRGELPHLALDQSDVHAAVAAVTARCAEVPFRDFQILISDGMESAVVVHRQSRTSLTIIRDPFVVLSNEHLFGELTLPDLDGCLEPGLGIEARLDRLRAILGDEGEINGHRILKKGGEYGTVASSIIAIPAAPGGLIWRYAAGEPGAVPYRNYGNLGRRLAAPR